MKQPIIIPAQHQHQSSVIWLHGLGADGYDFEPLIPSLVLSKHTRFILPHAPVRPITLNGGMPMPGWYDVAGLNAHDREDEPGVKQSADLIRTLIAQEHAAGIDYQKIFLVGFSQGGAMALFTGLTYPEPLGGVIGLSTYMPIASVFADARQPANQNTPILMVHGTQDTVVEYAFGKKTQMSLRQQDYFVTWQDYPMAHEVCQPEIALISEWLGKRL